jgi:DNA-binding transcriptional MerR regulator
VEGPVTAEPDGTATAERSEPDGAATAERSEPGTVAAEAPARLRVDELATRAGVSVDTVRFYQRERLLPPPERSGRVAFYAPAHLDRLQRIRAWQRSGYPLALIRRALDGELALPDVPLAEAVWRATPDAEARPIEELAAEAGVPTALVERLVADGLLRADAADVPALLAGARLVALGIPVTELLELAHAYHTATRTLAEDAVMMFDRHVRQPALRDPAHAPERLVAAFETAMGAVHELVGGHFRRVLLDVAGEHLRRALAPDDAP